MKKLATLILCLAGSLFVASCGGGKSDAELGQEAAKYFIEQMVAEKAGDEAKEKEARDKMNEIRKPYMVGDKSGTPEAKAFNAAFNAAKKAAGY